MGKLLIFAKWYFFIWAGKNPAERLHIHVYRNNSRNTIGAKFWLDDLSLFEHGDFTDQELNQLRRDLVNYADQTQAQVQAVKPPISQIDRQMTRCQS